MTDDAPSYRVWPPLALGVPLAVGWSVTAWAGDPVRLPGALRPVGWPLVAAFALWNGWSLLLMARHRTALLPGGTTTRLLEHGPFRFSRNPLYLGLIALDAGLALLWPSFWALVLLPLGVALLTWGAILPEERYLRTSRGAEYETYARRVRRWL
ncbi:protein-S-isoprenylcysteine O-methyltransferase Ste14 [Streptacidiphilus sp. MAP12-20]|uniref:methyltransferase family protein n=1 Tax=Streptacidiphilus sp. MAP12-20 TaxID=3156299 RepID=UPI0035116C2C